LFEFLSFVVYFEWWSLEQGSGAHRMSHSCSNGAYDGIEWLFQLKDNEGIETMFQWFKVQCKMRNLHESCKVVIDGEVNEPRTHGVYWRGCMNHAF